MRPYMGYLLYFTILTPPPHPSTHLLCALAVCLIAGVAVPPVLRAPVIHPAHKQTAQIKQA